DRFNLQAPDTRSFSMPGTVTVNGTIRNQSSPIEAQLSFTPISKTPGVTPIPGVSPKAVMTSVVPSVIVPALVSQNLDYSVQLLSGVLYRMLVQPKDPQFAPYQRSIVAGNPVTQSVEFQDLQDRNDERTFVVSGVPSDHALLLEAFDQQTGESVSS